MLSAAAIDVRIENLHRAEQRARSVELTIADLQAALRQDREETWQGFAKHSFDFDIAHQSAERIQTIAARLQRLAGRSGETVNLLTTLRERAQDQAKTLEGIRRHGPPDPAFVTDLGFDPFFAAVIDQTGEAQANAAKAASGSAASARQGTLAAILLATIGWCVVFWRFGRAQRMAHEARADPLTGVANRAELYRRVASAAKGAHGASMIFLDLDDFKAINDSLGHASGDALLQEVATRLSTSANAGETVARLGGDEFALLLPGVVDPEIASARARAIVARLDEPVILAGRRVALRSTLGITTRTVETGMTAQDLLRDADLAMYLGKRAGKARIVVFEPSMHAAARDELAFEADLTLAVANAELKLQYQPIVSLSSGVVVGAEALVRWHHPERGLVPPLTFIPLAERSGAILEVGAFVLRAACVEAAGWQTPQREVGINVNVSPRQLQDPDFVNAVRTTLEQTGLPARLLTLEITETLLVERGDELSAVVDAIAALGVRLAIDDFGSGYSSLGMLQRFPVDELKIDKAFIDTLDGLGGDVLARTIVDLSHSMGLVPVAEGIEDVAQLAALQTLGCTLGQGYHFARPLEARTFAELLDAVPFARAA